MNKKILSRIMIFIGLILFAVLAFNIKPIYRLYQVMNLFKKDRIAYNFRNMNQIFGSRVIRHSENASQFQTDFKPLVQTFKFKDQIKNTEDFISNTDTTGLLIIKNNHILYEKYYNGYDAHSKMISWSLSKSLLSCMFGIAMDEGYIKSIDVPVEQYVPELKGTGYEGIRVEDILQMSSGIKFDENYSNSQSDINRMGRVLAFNTPIDQFVRSLKKGSEPGKQLHYVSMDTQVLAMVLRECLKKAGIGFSDYFESKIWKKLGMESDAYWLVDSKNMELAFGCLNATLRDYARFGSLYINKGYWNSNQIVPANWVNLSTKALKPHLLPGEELAKTDFGYGYQWWLPAKNDGDYTALGVYGQYIYIYPKYNTVIVKTSAYAKYNQDGAQKLAETIELFREIAKKM